jgi:hypothetical protein
MNSLKSTRRGQDIEKGIGAKERGASRSFSSLLGASGWPMEVKIERLFIGKIGL